MDRGQQEYGTLAALFEEYLQSHQPFGKPDSLYSPMRYINELGGKRIRPALVLMAYNLWSEDVTPALPAALAVEYFHHFSLVHDDIMDEAPLRRGKPSVHEKFGRNEAILSGDALLIRCFDLLLEAGKRNGSSAELCSFMCRVALEICEGQQMDMDLEKRISPTETEYLEMIRKKTACLFGLSLRLGAMLSGSSSTDSELLAEAGELMGLGFQIQDDYLDVFGETAQTGKQKGGDILQGKKNYLYVRTHHTLAPSAQSEFADQYFKAGREKVIEPVLDFYREKGIDQYARNVAEKYFQTGVEKINAIDGVDGKTLVSFLEKLMQRKH